MFEDLVLFVVDLFVCCLFSFGVQVCHQKDGLGSQMFLKGCGVFRQGAVHLMLYALDPLAKGN